ncbi:MAG: flippase-like domain-containing protein [Halobacteriaceae archaeon]
MDPSDVEVSVVLPAYNEEETIESTVRTTISALDSFLPAGSFEIIITEDGCDDNTPAIASQLADEMSQVRHLHSDSRLGRGGALSRAFKNAHGSTLAYFDTDLATDISHLEELINSIRKEGYDIATGSRWIPGNEAERPIKRGIPSQGFNFLVRTLLGSSIRDHQCGFKAFDRDVLLTLLPTIKDNHWFWDTELLTRAQRRGYDVKEFPVRWTPKGDSKVDIVRDIFGMGSQILRCWWEFNVQPRITRRTGMVVGILLVITALVLMTFYLEPSKVLAEMQDANATLVFVAAIVYIFSWPIRGQRYKDILERLGYEEGLGFLTGAIFISQTGNLVFPARVGDAVRAYVMKTRRSVPYPTGFASLTVERVFDLLTITGLAGSVLVLLGIFMPERFLELFTTIQTTDRQSGRIAILVATIVGLGAIGIVLIIFYSAQSERNYVRLFVSKLSDDSYVAYVTQVLEQFTGDVQRVAGNRHAFIRVIFTSVFIWVLDVITAIIVLVAFDIQLSILLVATVGFFAVSVGNLAKVLPLSPGGIGLYEGAFTLLVVVLTPISPAIALGAAIVDHAVKNVITIMGGVGSMIILNVSLTQAVQGSKEAGATSSTSED